MYTIHEDGWGWYRARIRIGHLCITSMHHGTAIDAECAAFNIIMAACEAFADE